MIGSQIASPQRVVSRRFLSGVLVALMLSTLAALGTSRALAPATAQIAPDTHTTQAPSEVPVSTGVVSGLVQATVPQSGACSAGQAITGDLIWGNEGNGGSPGPIAVYQAACGR
jgi:hypothetical protein